MTSGSIDLKKTRFVREGQKDLPRFDPQLPRHIWEQFKKDYRDSIIFTAFFSDMRHEILTHKLSCISLENPKDPEILFDDFFPPIVTSIAGSKKDVGTMGGSWLHLAVTQGDLPLAHECIRLGTPIEHKDRRGYSALYFACTVVKDFLLPDGFADVTVCLPAGPGRKPTRKFDIDLFISQLIQICLFLLDQHTDANEMHDGLSLLGLACLSDQWDLIRALLLHGAHTSPSSPHPPMCFLKTADARSKFSALVAQRSGKPRPRRLCPCGSERALDQCHSNGNAQPYPEEGICPCGAGKIYAKCCVKRQDMYWVEKWDSHNLALERICFPRVTRIPEVQKMAEEQAHSPDFRKNNQLPYNYSQAVLKRLAESDQIDPAYAAAGFKNHLNPIMPKVELNETIQKWNAAVDEYIASGVDSRTTEAIENAAKVGATGGPLFRRCEAAGCRSTENRNSVTVYRCRGCHTTVYCSRSCQKGAWKAHKLACRAGKVQAQMLPSQEAYVERMGFAFASNLLAQLTA
ncbi:hypothetical protein B0H11DRAFT_2056339 [Mycena galericulata]|nr:hypothetical protein B0H11DRAFT_2056339 [Mycena galericulata]